MAKPETGNMVTVKFFAQVRELAGVESLQAPLPQPATVDALRNQLMQQSPTLNEALQGNVLMAHNQSLCDGNTVIAEQDEVAFFPPVTGG